MEEIDKIKEEVDVSRKDTENMKLEIGDTVLKEYLAGVLVCKIVGEHENWERTYNIDVLFTSIGRDATKERNDSDKPLYANFPKYKSQKLEDLR